jgi:hypothetical protein
MRTEEDGQPTDTLKAESSRHPQVRGRKGRLPMRDGEAPDILDEMGLNLARHNLEVSLKRIKEHCFRAAKECASESLEGARKMDAFVRSQYADEPRKMAEWEEIMLKYAFSDEEEEGEE